jgi:hypothetical protein
MFSTSRPSHAETQAARWRRRAEAASRDLRTIETLPPAEAVEFIRARAAEEQARREAAERAQAEREARATKLQTTTRHPPDHGPIPPSRGLGR